MTERRKVVCDGCEADLTTRGGTPRSLLCLASVPISPVVDENGLSVEHAVHLIPAPLTREPRHFCGLGCLAGWLARHHIEPNPNAK